MTDILISRRKKRKEMKNERKKKTYRVIWILKEKKIWTIDQNKN